MGAAMYCMVGVTVCWAFTISMRSSGKKKKKKDESRKPPQRKRTKDELEGSRRRSLSDVSFSLGEPEAPFLRVPDNQMAWFESEIRRSYSVDEEKQNGGHYDFRGVLARLRELVEPLEQDSWQVREPLDDVLLSRVLIATDFNVDKSFALVSKYLTYRKELGGIRAPTEFIESGCTMIPFEDRYGRPVVFVRGKHILTSMSEETVERGYRAYADVVVAHLLHKRGCQVSGSNPLEQYVMVFEAKDVGWSNFSMLFAKIMIRESAAHYPERVAQMVILNCNALAKTCVQLVLPLLHPRTSKKLRLITKDKVPAFMQSLVEPEKLPKEYGGGAPDFVHPSAIQNDDELMGKLMASTYRRLGISSHVKYDDESSLERSTTMQKLDRTPSMVACCAWRS